jgi:hypothetical protein
MMTPTVASPFELSSITPAQVAFRALPLGHQRLVAALVFDGRSCASIARATGAAATWVREQAGAALRALGARLVPADDAPAGAVEAMLMLRAAGALEADEAAQIDLMLRYQPTLQRAYGRCGELIGALCTLAPPCAPSDDVLVRLLRAIDDDAAN